MNSYQQICYRSPGKVIISGEHSVVYGKVAVAAAIELWTYVTVKNSTRDRITLNDEEIKSFSTEEKILSLISQALNIQIKNVDIDVRSDIPLSAGMGSSASYSLSLIYALCHFFKGKPDQDDVMVQLAKQIENIFHGRTGSGLDVMVSHTGGIIRYQKDQGFNRLGIKNWNKKFLMIDSTVRKQSTEQALEVVREKLKQIGDGILADIENTTLEIIKNLVEGDSLDDHIQQNQKLLSQLGVSVPEIDEIVNLLSEYGIVAKLTGAGLGGFCVALTDTIPDLQGFNKYPYLQFGLCQTGTERVQ